MAPPALLDFVRELARDFPDVRQRIADRAELQSGDAAKLVATTRREIAKVSAEPGWTRHWSNERHIPDYSRVRERLESLLASGHADAVMDLGDEILRRGIEQLAASDDEGDNGDRRLHGGCFPRIDDVVQDRSGTPAGDRCAHAGQLLHSGRYRGIA